MKLSFLLVLISLLQVSASSLAQTINFSHKQTSFEDIIREIKKQTTYSVLVSAKNAETIGRRDVNFKNATLNEVMGTFLKDSPLSYEIQGDIVLLKSIEPRKVYEAPPVRIVARVQDDKGQPLQGVTVKVKGTSNLVITNKAGDFSISIPDESAILVFSFIGFQSREISARSIPGVIQSIHLRCLIFKSFCEKNIL